MRILKWPKRLRTQEVAKAKMSCTLQYSAMQCNAMQCSNALNYILLLYFTSYCCTAVLHCILLHYSTAVHFFSLQYTDHDNIADDLKPFLGCIVRAAITNKIPRWPDKGSVGQEQMRVDPEWPEWQYGGQSGGSMVAIVVAVWWPVCQHGGQCCLRIYSLFKRGYYQLCYCVKIEMGV